MSFIICLSRLRISLVCAVVWHVLHNVTRFFGDKHKCIVFEPNALLGSISCTSRLLRDMHSTHFPSRSSMSLFCCCKSSATFLYTLALLYALLFIMSSRKSKPTEWRHLHERLRKSFVISIHIQKELDVLSFSLIANIHS